MKWLTRRSAVALLIERLVPFEQRPPARLRATLTVADVILIPFQPRNVDLWTGSQIGAQAMTIKMPHIVKPGDTDRKAKAFIAGGALKATPAAPDDIAGKAVVNMRFDGQLLARVDAAAKRQGISRTAWLHVATSRALDQ
jgi:hypothetical protein